MAFTRVRGRSNDILEGRGGADTLIGGFGTDTASYANSAAGVTADLGTPANNSGDAAADSYNSIENLTGSSNADTLTGDGGSNVLDGGAGADTINGGTRGTGLGRAGHDLIVINAN